MSIVQSEDQPIRIKARDFRGRNFRTPAQIALDNQAADLRNQSKTWSQIAEIMGVSQSTAFDMAHRAIAEIPKEGAEGLLKIELAKLDAMERKYLEVINRFHPVVTMSGKLVVLNEREAILDGQDDVLLMDDGPTMTALAGLLKVSQHRAKLLGLYAPTNVRLEVVSFESDAIDAEYAEFYQRSLNAGSGDPETVLDDEESQG